ncbi:hypothetical protein K2Z83_01100 [Oscillochloris sp. ZM17-4]|nr:hypothetical protein [Oscillochloris sp. ZM17-4]MBX0326291.1 hypothetical protein [Oscillochloris sp. ZM17-4]
MLLTPFVRNTGMLALAGALIWILALVVEYSLGLFPPGSGPLFLLN